MRRLAPSSPLTGLQRRWTAMWKMGPRANLGSSADANADAAAAEPFHPLNGLRNKIEGVEYEGITWYDFESNGHPTLRFYRWAHRHCDNLPADVRLYYRNLLRQETKASKLLNVTWDVVVAIAGGYHKTRWVLEKYNVPYGAVPEPFDDFWGEETYEERRAAYMRSLMLKEAQALQREDTPETPCSFINRGTASQGSFTRSNGRGAGDFVHADDLPAPTEGTTEHTRFEETLSMMRGYNGDCDDMVLTAHRARQNRRKMEDNEELYGFEDEDEDYVPPPRKSPVM